MLETGRRRRWTACASPLEMFALNSKFENPLRDERRDLEICGFSLIVTSKEA